MKIQNMFIAILSLTMVSVSAQAGLMKLEQSKRSFDAVCGASDYCFSRTFKIKNFKTDASLRASIQSFLKKQTGVSAVKISRLENVASILQTMNMVIEKAMIAEARNTDQIHQQQGLMDSLLKSINFKTMIVYQVILSGSYNPQAWAYLMVADPQNNEGLILAGGYTE